MCLDQANIPGHNARSRCPGKWWRLWECDTRRFPYLPYYNEVMPLARWLQSSCFPSIQHCKKAMTLCHPDWLSDHRQRDQVQLGLSLELRENEVNIISPKARMTSLSLLSRENYYAMIRANKYLLSAGLWLDTLYLPVPAKNKSVIVAIKDSSPLFPKKLDFLSPVLDTSFK